jgi:hypothetical protein
MCGVEACSRPEGGSGCSQGAVVDVHGERLVGRATAGLNWTKRVCRSAESALSGVVIKPEVVAEVVMAATLLRAAMLREDGRRGGGCWSWRLQREGRGCCPLWKETERGL